MLNTFEKEKEDKYRLANIILLEIPNHHKHKHHKHHHKDEDDHDEIEEPSKYIIGGYASDGWAASQELLGNGGDESCFLFNLT